MNLPFSVENIEYFLLIFVRISTVMALLPVFGSQAVPIHLKVGLSLILAMLIFNIVMINHPVLPSVSTFLQFIALTVKEVVVGLIIGFTASLLFTAVQFGGWLIDTEMGFGFVELMDPFTDEPITVFGQLQIILFTLLFLILNGHYFLLLAIQKSFEIIPLSGVNLANGQILSHVLHIFSGIFVCALQFAAPVFVTLIIIEIALGVIARTVPQINIFFVGLPLKIIVGLGTAILVLPLLAKLFEKTFQVLIIDIHRLLLLLA